MRSHPFSDQLFDQHRTLLERTLTVYFGSYWKEICSHLELVELEKYEHLMKMGDIGHELYILLTGSLDAYIEKEGETKHLGTIYPGETVGEMALVQDAIRTASVKARRASRLVKLERTKFDQLVVKYPQLAMALNKVLVKRLDSSNQTKKSPNTACRYIAFYPLDEHIDISQFAEHFMSYWSNKEIQLFGPSDLALLQDGRFEQNDFNILLCTESLEDNTKLMDLADKVVYFADGLKTRASEHLFHSAAQDQDELVLRYDSNKPQFASEWLPYFKASKIYRHQHGNKSHEDRIIRIISETAISLVFGGGGAHGLANLGVVKALTEKGIPIDILGGSSVGSIFSGALAFDWEYEQFHQKIKESLSDQNPLNDYTFPFVALLKGRRMASMLKKHFDLDFLDQWKNIFVVASNLSSSKLEVIETGSLHMAIRASISIPGILPPVLHKNALLVDGGVINNLPTDIMRNLYNSYVISVDVVSPQNRSINHRYPVGNWQYIKNMISGSRKNYVPSTSNTILKTMTLGSLASASEKAKASDLYIQPRAKKGFLAWKAIEVFEQNGYEKCNDVLDGIEPSDLFDLPEM